MAYHYHTLRNYDEAYFWRVQILEGVPLHAKVAIIFSFFLFYLLAVAIFNVSDINTLIQHCATILFRQQ